MEHFTSFLNLFSFSILLLDIDLSRPRRSRSRSINGSGVASNPGNNLYITGLSTRITSSDLEKYFNSEGKVLECHLVTDPHTRESRGFAFVTVETTEHADRCIKYLNCSVLEGRLITMEKVLLPSMDFEEKYGGGGGGKFFLQKNVP
ncbi:serine/arginine-rich splicing factor SR45a-like [Populus nigra]|uniref:serine/arginine-rich splicing factor SR45a-like n=1 Tax=Populus nigra TaxID=3691 RepID=UPI002B27889E|nr:serine/arginine-rich splicing factor SR45a-like [Populus nigra]